MNNTNERDKITRDDKMIISYVHIILSQDIHMN